MSNQDGFAGGFLAGALFGSVVGGILGAALTSRLAQSTNPDDPKRIRERSNRSDRSPQSLQSDDDIEAARQILEAKIAQLNTAIDDVRHQLHNVNGSASELERPLPLSEDN
jgi:septal ring factor EnvC (AmiA/AmiB activator)